MPDTENVARFGRDIEQAQRFIDDWTEFQLSRTLSVPDLEFVRLCLSCGFIWLRETRALCSRRVGPTLAVRQPRLVLYAEVRIRMCRLPPDLC